MNFIKTCILMALMTFLFMWVGFLLAGKTGMLIAFLIAGAVNFYSYRKSGNAVLSAYQAQQVNHQSAPEYYEIVSRLAGRANMPMPKVYIYENPQPNAFATGRNPRNASVAVSTGLLDLLSPEEIAGVIAHELAHIEHRDTLTMTITATFAGAIAMLANFAIFFGGDRNNPLGFVGALVTMIVAPFAALLVQMSVSRTREYSADRRGAEICGDPYWLASALHSIAPNAKATVNAEAENNPATAHMFIINPLTDTARGNLFSTHPDTDKRIAALEALAKEWGQSGENSSNNWISDTSFDDGKILPLDWPYELAYS